MPATLCCDTCHDLFHGECLGFDSQTLQQFANIVHITGWVCLACREIVSSHLHFLQSHQTDLITTGEKLKEDVAKLQQDVCLYRQYPSTAVPDSVGWPSLPTTKDHKKQFLAVVPADLEDSRRKQSSIIVSGLVPKPGVSNVDLFLDVGERNLTLKPYIVFTMCRRLGRP
jgi:hypothetical protein